MSDTNVKTALAKIIIVLQKQGHGCNEEAINIAKQALGHEIEHNHIREMINHIDDRDIEKFISKSELPLSGD